MLVLFTALFIVGGLALQRSLSAVERSGNLTSAHLAAQAAGSREDVVEDAFEQGERLAGALGGRGSAPLRRRARALTRDFDRAAADLDGVSGSYWRSVDLAIGGWPVVPRRCTALRQRLPGLPRGVGRRDDRAPALEEGADTAQDSLQPLINGTGTKYLLAQQLDEIDRLELRHGRLLGVTLVVVPAGMVLYGVLLAVFAAYRRRLDRAAETELRLLREAVHTDRLTGLGNRRALLRDLEALGSATTSMALLDLVGLKAVNDRKGHLAGDAVLRTLGRTLTDVTGERGLCYRVGGDEFAVLFRRESAVSAAALLDQVRLRQIQAGGANFRAGFAPAAPGESSEDLTRRADTALVAARGQRRGFVVYAPDLELEPEETGADAAGRQALTTALAQAVDAKDSYTRSHCETVATVAALIAEELGIEPGHLAKVRRAGLMHDVGKIGIPDTILQKPAKLDAQEWEVMRSHSQLGADILAAAGLHSEAHWVLHHHERMDGGGYPIGLDGPEIPLESRILMVADTFEAITADRPYRAAASHEEALAELKRHAGTQFDPECVAALARVLDTWRHEAAEIVGTPALV